MKITKAKIKKYIEKNPRGVDFQKTSNAMRAFSQHRRNSVGRLLKSLLAAGEIRKKGKNYLPLAPKKGSRSKGEVKKDVVKKDVLKNAALDYMRVANQYELPLSFPDNVLREAEQLKNRQQKEIKNRRKVDDWVITIDSESARDLDDAISIRRRGGGYELGVHIADVGWYVRKGSLLDQEARDRSTSVYLIDKVIPMFPEILSNDLCSLNAGEPKLCFSAFINIAGNGKVRDVHFERTVVEVDRRCSYKEVEAALRGEKSSDEPEGSEYGEKRDSKPGKESGKEKRAKSDRKAKNGRKDTKGKKDKDSKKFKQMGRLASILRKQRMKQGSLAFEIPEIKIELDEKGRPESLTVPERLESEMLIEEFMLIANQQVSHFLENQGASLFRVHEDPDSEKLAGFFSFANKMGLRIGRQPAEITPLAVQRLLRTISTSPAAGTLNMLLIRSMQKAVYSADNPGHFGLGFSTYTHFTSPIRRYPDLIVHRLLESALRGKRAYNRRSLEKIAEHASEQEHKAISAERDLIRIKGARYLAGKKGEPVQARITSVVEWGMFLTLLPYGLDGMLHISELKDDHYKLDALGHLLTGTRHGKQYTIGQIVEIKIKSVNIEKGFVDLSPVNLPLKIVEQGSENQ